MSESSSQHISRRAALELLGMSAAAAAFSETTFAQAPGQRMVVPHRPNVACPPPATRVPS